MPSNVMNTQPIFQPAQVMLAHQLLKNMIAREKTKSLAETRPAAEARKLSLVGKKSRVELVDAEKMSELGMLAIKNRA